MGMDNAHLAPEANRWADGSQLPTRTEADATTALPKRVDPINGRLLMKARLSIFAAAPSPAAREPA